MLPFLGWLYFISSASCTCNFQSKWTIDEKTLDLSTFQALGTNITGADLTYTYQFSPVNNLAHVESGYSPSKMLQQFENGTPTNLYYSLTSYDPIKPTVSFNNNSNIEWTFKYSTNISIKYICDPLVLLEPPYISFTNILELIPGIFLFEVSSPYFCPNNTAPITMAQNECIWTDKSDLYTLNLTNLFGTSITIKQKNYPNNDFFFYSICADNTSGSTSSSYNYIPCGMSAIAAQSGSTTRQIYTSWNSSVQPSYNVQTESWTFIYNVIATGSNYAPSQMSIQWVCDTNIDPYKVTNVAYVNNQWVGSLTISSKYVCNSECSFQTNDGNNNYYNESLDLHALSGTEIYGIADDLTYSIVYTPCSNNIDCNDEEVMAMKWDVDNRVCKDYLAVFNGSTGRGYNLTFDEMAQQWHFVYTNGEYCPAANDPERKEIFNIYWKCNHAATTWNVTTIETNNQCEYSMYIDTKFAC